MSIVFTTIAFVLAAIYATAGSVYAYRLSRRLDTKTDWYALFINVQQHAMVGGNLSNEVRGQTELPEFLALKRVIRIFYATFIPVSLLAFVFHWAEW